MDAKPAPMFQVNDDDPTIIPERDTFDWPQVAEMLHAADGKVRTVTALQDDPYGFFSKGDVLYTSKGPAEEE